MTDTFTDRINAILPRIISDEFLTSSGIGNEIAFYVFDYPPEYELQVRDHIRFLMEQLPKLKPALRVRHINLFDLLIEHLTNRKLLGRSLDMQKANGDDKLLRSLKPILDGEKTADVFTAAAQPDATDLVLVSGVGSVWPLLRSHSLLNNLHSRMGQVPLVMFYPGKYDGKSLRLFGKVKGDNYYRAFRLVT